MINTSEIPPILISKVLYAASINDTVQGVPGMLPLQAFLRNAPEGDFQKSGSGTTFHCLPICISTYHFGPSWSDVTPQLPDKLSESEISANSSGIKITCTKVGHQFKKRESGFLFVDELTTGDTAK